MHAESGTTLRVHAVGGTLAHLPSTFPRASPMFGTWVIRRTHLALSRRRTFSGFRIRLNRSRAVAPACLRPRLRSAQMRSGRIHEEPLETQLRSRAVHGEYRRRGWPWIKYFDVKEDA